MDVRFSVQNPLNPLLKDDPANVWRQLGGVFKGRVVLVAVELHMK